MIGTPCPHGKSPCPECAGLDVYGPYKGNDLIIDAIKDAMCKHGYTTVDMCPRCSGTDRNEMKIVEEYLKESIRNNVDIAVTGDNNPYYEFNDATCMADLTDNMSFNRGCILKAVLRWDEKESKEYNLQKIIYYARREMLQVQADKEDR